MALEEGAAGLCRASSTPALELHILQGSLLGAEEEIPATNQAGLGYADNSSCVKKLN